MSYIVRIALIVAFLNDLRRWLEACNVISVRIIAIGKISRAASFEGFRRNCHSDQY